MNYLLEQIPSDEDFDPYGTAVVTLAERAGIHPDSISKPLQGARANISFASADRLLCAMGMPQLWRDDPGLYEAYWHPYGPPPDPMKPVKCRNPKCSEWFELEELPCTGAAGGTKFSRRVYCDKNCRARAFQALHPKRRSRAVMKHRRRNREAYNAYMREYRARKAAERSAVTA